jgi:hypothetical protein
MDRLRFGFLADILHVGTLRRLRFDDGGLKHISSPCGYMGMYGRYERNR